MARHLAGVAPLGQRVALGSANPPTAWATIVGVVADYRNNGMTQPVRPEIYVPVRQQTAWNQLFMLIRADTDARRAAAAGPADDLGDGSRSARVQHSNARRCAGGDVVLAADFGGAGRHLCRRRAGAGGDRDLRRHVVRGERAHTGDWASVSRSAHSGETWSGSSSARSSSCAPSASRIGIVALDRRRRSPRRPAVRRPRGRSGDDRSPSRWCWPPSPWSPPGPRRSRASRVDPIEALRYE